MTCELKLEHQPPQLQHKSRAYSPPHNNGLFSGVVLSLGTQLGNDANDNMKTVYIVIQNQLKNVIGVSLTRKHTHTYTHTNMHMHYIKDQLNDEAEDSL